jgi:DNA topoisomerase-1
MFNIELPDALELFKLPRKLGILPGCEPVSANTGMFGPYVQYETVDKETGEVVKKYASLQAGDPLTVTLEEAIEVIRAKQEADAKKLVKDFGVDGIRILNGRWGPYLADAERNARIPRVASRSPSRWRRRQLLADAPVRKRRWGKKVVKKAAKNRKEGIERSWPMALKRCRDPEEDQCSQEDRCKEGKQKESCVRLTT